MRDFYTPYSLDEGKAYIDRARAVHVLNEQTSRHPCTDHALLVYAINRLDAVLQRERHNLRGLPGVSARCREHHVADGWFVPIAPKGVKESYGTLCRKTAPMKPRANLYGSQASTELYRIAESEYPDDADRLTGYCGLMLYRLNDAVWWIGLLAGTARARSPYLMHSLAP